MYVVTNRIDVPAERAAAFEERFIGNMRNNLPKVAGLSRATLDRPVDENTPYKVTMEFDSESDFETWRDSEAFRSAHGRPASAAPGNDAPATEAPKTDAAGPADPQAPAPRAATGPEHHIRIETFEGGRA